MIDKNAFLKSNSTQAKRILFVISEDWYFMSHRLFLAKYAISQGYKVSLLTKATIHKKEIESYGIHIVDWPISRRSANIFSELKSIFVLLKVIKNFKPDIIHSVALKPILYGAFCAKICKIPVRIFAFAGLGYIFSSSQFLAKVLRPIIVLIMKFLLKNKHSTLVMQNKDDQNIFLQENIVLKSQICIIKGAGVDLKLFSVSKNITQPPIVLLPARLLRDKGIEDFVKAATILKKDGLNARFVIAGREDPSNPESVDQAFLEKLKESNIVELWGHIDDMAGVLQRVSVVCLPSFREGLPKALLEAASCGKAIVSYDVPGCREVVINKVNGFLVEFRNIIGMSDAVKTLLLNNSLRESMGNEGRRLVIKHFSQEEIAMQTESLWKSRLKILNA